MKTKLRVSALLVALSLVLGFGSMPAFAESDDSINTMASISFSVGVITFTGDMEKNISFGINKMPVSASTYPSINRAGETEHVVAVLDSRLNAGNWNVTARLTAFTSVDDDPPSSFNAAIKFVNAAPGHSNSAGNLTGLTASPDFELLSGGGDVLVMSASDALVRDMYAVTWANDDVTLSISDAEVRNIDHVNYEAQLVWVLTLSPNDGVDE